MVMGVSSPVWGSVKVNLSVTVLVLSESSVNVMRILPSVRMSDFRR